MKLNIQKIQKVVFMGALISVALLFVYSLVCGSPAYAITYFQGWFNKDANVDIVAFQEAFNAFNLNVLYVAIAGFVCFALLGIFSQGSRKRYYISNFIVPVIFLGYSIFTAISVIPGIVSFSAQYNYNYNAIKFDKLPSYLTKNWVPSNSFLIDIGWVPVILLLIVSALLVAIAAYKFIKQTKADKLAKEAE